MFTSAYQQNQQIKHIKDGKYAELSPQYSNNLNFSCNILENLPYKKSEKYVHNNYEPKHTPILSKADRGCTKIH